MKRSTKFILSCTVLALIALHSFSQEKKVSLNAGADIMSRYIWRGTDFGNAPSVQPTLSVSAFGIELGAWGAYSISGPGYQEADLYLSYTFINDMFTIGATDYFFPGDTCKNNYFDYDDKTTGHTFEANLSFNGNDKIPFNASANYNFAGADQDNSWYFEIGYSGSIQKTGFNIFMGFTPDKGIYLTPGAEGFSVVNVGITATRDIKITESFSLPVQASLITNPQAENIFIVFGFSL
ncbi:MAG: hypothetical protein KKA81_07335 [Bacteroidetes bacterium]|nr:hypothetical protein [Bacteroidota bacterium]